MNDNASDNNQPNILVVDDTPENVKILVEMLSAEDYKIRPTTSGKFALEAAKEVLPDLILLDINMPEMNGYEVCQKLKEDKRTRNIPIIFISALSDTLDKVKAFKTGGVDYVTKPFQQDEVKARVNAHLEIHRLHSRLEKHNIQLEELVKEKMKEIYESQMATILALAELAESRDDDTGKHLDRIQIYCKMLAEKLGKNEKYKNIINAAYVVNIFFASPMHDIGKVGIPDNVLLKPDKLTSEEFEIMKTHTTIGANTLERVRSKYPKNTFINMGIGIARSHHERWDGTGYPDGLSSEDIPLSARIMTVVDVYDALRSKRCYKQPRAHEETCEIIIKGSGTQFDPIIIETFKNIHNEFENKSKELMG